MTLGLLDHLWQSSLFAGAAALLTLTLTRNGAGLRFWLWFAASVKFLVPFAALAVLGAYLSRLFPAALPRSLLAIQPAAERLSAPARMLMARHSQSADLAPLLLGLWLLGVAAVLGLRLVRGLRLRAVLAEARDLMMPGPVRIKASSSLLEPGLVGILKPVVLLPDGLMARLSGPERDSILAHELGHLRRGDNVTAAIHMAVETLFWFWPPVWLIGARLIAERERACDESVLAQGHDPEVYAGSILKVCKFCIQSPLACAPGASGADLAGRVRLIMTGEAALRLGAGKRLLLACAAALALGLPVMAGFLASPLAVEVQKKVATVRAQVAASFTRNVTAVAEDIGIALTAHVQVTRLPRLKVVKVAAAIPALPPEPAPVQQDAAPIPVAPQVQPEQKAAAPAPASATVKDVKEALLAITPTGQGDPGAVTCRVPQLLPGSRLPGPEVCKTNRVWAQLRAEGQDISPDGTTLIATLSRSRALLVLAGNCYDVNPLPVIQNTGLHYSTSSVCY
jgi:beta-lactamase regulating signal transducer with metallopeptidase domain